MYITNKRYLIASLTGILLTPCIVKSAAEADVDIELQEAIENCAQEYDQELERQHQRAWATEQLKAEEEERKGRAWTVMPEEVGQKNEEEVKANDDESSDEDERPERIEVLAGSRYANERHIYYQPEMAQRLIAHVATQASSRFQQAMHYLPEASRLAIKGAIEEFRTHPWQYFQVPNRSILQAVHAEADSLHNFVEESIATPTLMHLRDIILKEAEEKIKEAQLTKNFDRGTIVSMEQQLARLRRVTAAVNDRRVFKQSLGTRRTAIEQLLRTGKEAAAKKTLQTKQQLQQQADFASDISGMGGFY